MDSKVHVPDKNERQTEDHQFSEMMEEIAHAGDGNGTDSVTVGEVIESMGSRSFGPMILLPSVLALIPVIGSIPGISAVIGVWLILICLQMLVGRKSIWVPSRIQKIKLNRKKWKKSAERIIPIVEKCEWVVGCRLEWLTRFPFTPAIAFCCILLAGAMIPLELIPFGVTPPAAALVVFGVALTAHDGLLAIAGFLLTVASAVMTLWIF